MKPRYDSADSYQRIFKVNLELPCYIFSNQYRTPSSPSLRANWHEELELQYIIEGEGYLLIDGERFEVTAGDVVVANQNCVHFTGTETAIRYTAMLIKADFLNFASVDYGKVIFETVIKSERIERLFSDVLAACGETGRICKKARVQMALLALLIELREQHAKEENSSDGVNKRFTVVKNTIGYIRENYDKKLSLEALAEHTFTDKFSLSRSFKTVTGQTVVEYINNYRCDRAKELIRKGTPINEAAVQCGFNNMSFFTKTFKKYTGINPSEYKKK